MPLADQRGRVARVAHQRGHGRLLDGGRPTSRLPERLLQADRQAVLVAPGDQADARRRAHRAVGVGVREHHALGRQPVEHRRRVVAPAVATEVGVTEVVGHDVQDVRLAPAAALRRGRAPPPAPRCRAPRRARCGGLSSALAAVVIHGVPFLVCWIRRPPPLGRSLRSSRSRLFLACRSGATIRAARHPIGLDIQLRQLHLDPHAEGVAASEDVVERGVGLRRIFGKALNRA